MCEFSFLQDRQIGFIFCQIRVGHGDLLRESLSPRGCLVLRVYIERLSVKEEKLDHIFRLFTK